MLNNEKELFILLDKLFIPSGFIRKKDTYYLITEVCICFFSIGKSSLGGHFDHIMGCFLKEIMKEQDIFPKYNRSHLKFSLRELASKNLVKEVFDFENCKYFNNQRETIIKDLIEDKAIPFLKDISSKAGILDSVKKYKGLMSWIKGDLTNYLFPKLI